MAERKTAPAEIEPAEPPPTSKDLANAKQRRHEAERAKQAEHEDDIPEGARKVREIAGVTYVLVNGGWVPHQISGKAR